MLSLDPEKRQDGQFFVHPLNPYLITLFFMDQFLIPVHQSYWLPSVARVLGEVELHDCCFLYLASWESTRSPTVTHSLKYIVKFSERKLWSRHTGDLHVEHFQVGDDGIGNNQGRGSRQVSCSEQQHEGLLEDCGWRLMIPSSLYRAIRLFSTFVSEIAP